MVFVIFVLVLIPPTTPSSIIDAIPNLAAPRHRLRGVVLAILLALVSSSVAFAQLSPTDLDRLARYGTFWELVDAVATLAPERQREMAEATARARADFAGRGADIARHFLAHTDHRVRNEAYWFVLGALADVQAATLLIRALPEPPNPAVGVLPRDQGEIQIALETMLASPAIADSEVVTTELIKAIEVRTPRSGPPDMAVQLLGKCRTPMARAVLDRLLADPLASVRGLAAKALGEGASVAGGDVAVPVEGLVRVLQRDSDPQARIAAAGALARLGTADAIGVLNQAIDQEQTPQVVDAIHVALRNAGSPITDPNRCRAILERSWEPVAARSCFESWRRVADWPALIEAAEKGSPVLRILAIETLIQRAPKKQIVSALPSAPPDIDPQLRARLLPSLRNVLSTPHSQLSPMLPLTAQQMLWAVSGHDIATALEYADDIVPLAARFAVSKDLAGRDVDGYARARRPRQLMSALLIAVIGLALALLPRARAAGLCIAASGVAWALWISRATDVRTLPPPPPWLMFLTVPAIALLAGGATAALSAWLVQKWGVQGMRRLAVSAATVAGAVFVAVVVTSWSRENRVFPGDSAGWDLMFEPLAVAMLAAIWTTVLVTATWLTRRATAGSSRTRRAGTS